MSPYADRGVEAPRSQDGLAFEVRLPGTCSDAAFVAAGDGGEEGEGGEGVDADGLVGGAGSEEGEGGMRGCEPGAGR